MGASESKAKFWKQHIEDWKQSGLGQREYCEKHNISYGRLGYWRTRLKRTSDTTNKFLPVTLKPTISSIGIFLPGGIRLEASVADLAVVLPVVYRAMREAS